MKKACLQSIYHACSVVSGSLQLHGLYPARLFYPWNFPGSNTGGSCHFLLQRIFLTQGMHRSLLYLLLWQADSLPLSHRGSPIKCVGRFNFFVDSSVIQIKSSGKHCVKNSNVKLCKIH